jgi:hypothetical protein
VAAVIGGPEILIVLAFIALPIWALIDAASRPDAVWTAADQSKTMWIVLLVIGILIVFPVGIIVALIYLLSIRQKLAKVREAS